MIEPSASPDRVSVCESSIDITSPASASASAASPASPAIAVSPAPPPSPFASPLLDGLPRCFPLGPSVDPGRFVRTTFLVVVPVALFVALFSEIGLGYAFLAWSRETGLRHGELIHGLRAALVLAVAIMYFFDVERWHSYRYGTCFRNAWLLGTFATVVLLLLLSADAFAYGTLFLFVLFLPFYLASLKRLTRPSEKPRAYSAALAGPLFLVSLLLGTGFVVWTRVSIPWWWDPSLHVAQAVKAGCVPDLSLARDCDETCLQTDGTVSSDNDCPNACHAAYDGCLHPLVLWAWPLLCAALLFFLSFVCSFFRADRATDHDLVPRAFVRVWIVIFAGLWTAASLSGRHHLEMLAGLGLCLATAVGLSVGLTLGHPKYLRALGRRVRDKYGSFVDLLLALLILVGSPAFAAYLAVSFLNQRVRTLRARITRRGRCAVPKSSDGTAADSEATDTETDDAGSSAPYHDGWLTERTAAQIRGMGTWEFSKLFEWTIYLGMGFVGTAFVQAYINVILSWIIQITKSAPFELMSVYVVITGVVMFLCPAVPGGPIYIFAGLMLVPSFENSQYGGSRILGVAVSCIISLITKMIACACQQKIIGQSLSHFVRIRQMVCINTDLMRGTKMILSSPRLTMAKVSILCGGPDWPTSVMCGIMGLDLLPVLLGTLPVILIIVPAVLSGFFVYVQGEEDDEEQRRKYGVFGLLSFLAGAVVYVKFLTRAAAVIEIAVRDRQKEIEALPMDEDVREADEAEAEMRRACRRAGRWSGLPGWVRGALLFSTAAAMAAAHMTVWFHSRCFVEFDITDTIADRLGGKVLALVRPLGWTGLVLFGLSGLSCLIFKVWTKVGVVPC